MVNGKKSDNSYTCTNTKYSTVQYNLNYFQNIEQGGYTYMFGTNVIEKWFSDGVVKGHKLYKRKECIAGR